MSVAIQEIMWLVIAMGIGAIGCLLYAYFADNAMISASSKDEESDSEQGAFDDPHSEEYTQ